MRFNWLNFFRRKNQVVVESSPDFTAHYNYTDSYSDDFYSNLTRTINWTSDIVNRIDDSNEIDFSRIFRSVNPDYENKPFYTYDVFASTPPIPFNFSVVLDKVMVLRTNNNRPEGDIDKLGKILEFEIDITTHDGAPVAETKGFVDESDIPPIDTWFYITKSHLYCWIPAKFVDVMQGAMEVEIFGSYRWIKESKPYLHIEAMKRVKSMS